MPALPRRVRTWFEGLRFPILLLLTGALLIVDLIVPDAVPFIDEALLALLALVLARVKRSRSHGGTSKGEKGAGGAGDPEGGV